MTKLELLAQVAEKNKELMALQAQVRDIEQQEANKSQEVLDEMVRQAETLLDELRDFANEHELEFCIDTSWTTVEFDSGDYGNWNQSTC